MNGFTSGLFAVLSLIVTVSLVAVIVSKNANTSAVIQSSGTALSSFLQTAVSPVVGGGLSSFA